MELELKMKFTRLATKLIMAMESLEWRRIILIIPRQSPAEANQWPELRSISANGQGGQVDSTKVTIRADT
jgi:hypothetical protein